MKISIMGTEYDVIEKELLEDDYYLLGQVDYVKAIIYIKKGLKKDIKNKTFIHEVLHAILEQSGYSELNKNEDLVNSLSNSFYQVLKSNNLITFSF